MGSYDSVTTANKNAIGTALKNAITDNLYGISGDASPVKVKIKCEYNGNYIDLVYRTDNDTEPIYKAAPDTASFVYTVGPDSDPIIWKAEGYTSGTIKLWDVVSESVAKALTALRTTVTAKVTYLVSILNAKNQEYNYRITFNAVSSDSPSGGNNYYGGGSSVPGVRTNVTTTPTTTPAASGAGFSDVPTGSWFASAVKWAA